jgi:hypothetical protein
MNIMSKEVDDFIWVENVIISYVKLPTSSVHHVSSYTTHSQ